MSPHIVTQRIRDNVPVIDFVGWYVEEVSFGGCVSWLPLNRASTNQHGTHQAALIALAADYTGGTALGSLFTSFPVVGIHPHLAPDSAALWLVGLELKYLAPSTEHLRAVCEIPELRREELKASFLAGERCFPSLDIAFLNGETAIAHATATYFVQRTSQLSPKTLAERANKVYLHRASASARMILGIRARNSVAAERHGKDPYSEHTSSIHSQLLADYFQAALPELSDMVLARTIDADLQVRSAIADGAQQLVVIGAGLDWRTLRMSRELEGVRVFCLDLPHVLAARASVRAGIPEAPMVEETAVPIDLELQLVSEALANAARFDPSQTTMFLMEGVSMYLEPSRFGMLLEDLSEIGIGTDNRLWVDLVEPSVLESGSGGGLYDSFLAGLAELGEPFVNGVARGSRFFAGLGAEIVCQRSSADILDGPGSPLFEKYYFATVRLGVGPDDR